MIRRVAAPPTPSAQESLRGWLAEVVTWLSVGLGAFFTLLVCSGLALAEVRTPIYRDTRSRARADYSPWSSSVVHRVQAQILQAILQDRDPLPGAHQDPAMIALAPGELWASGKTLEVPGLTPSSVPMAGPSSAASTDLALPPLATPSLASSAPPTGPTTLPPTRAPPPTAQVLPTATITMAPSPTVISPDRPGKRSSDTYLPEGLVREYFLCDQRGSDTGSLCIDGTRGQTHSSAGLTPFDFYSDPLPGGTISGSLSAHIYLHAANDAGVPVPIGIMVYAGSGSWWPLGGCTLFAPGESSAPTLLDTAFGVLPHDLAPGDVIRLQITGGPGATFYWDGEFGESRLTLP